MKAKKHTKAAKYTIQKELVSSPDEEWYEFRIYYGKPKDGYSIASYHTLKEAKAAVKILAA